MLAAVSGCRLAQLTPTNAVVKQPTNAVVDVVKHPLAAEETQ